MRRSLLPFVAAGLLLAACGGSGSTDTAGTGTAAPGATSAVDATPDATASASSAPEAGPGDTAAAVAVPDALQFTAPAVGGGEIDFTRFAGRAVALWFWAPT